MRGDTANYGHGPERLSLAYFVRELQHYLHLDKGLPHTIVDLLRRPGPTLRGYFSGTARAGYTNPIAYSLMAAAASLLAYGLYRESFVTYMRTRLASSAAALPHDHAPQMAGFMRANTENVFQVTQHTALTSLTLALPQAVLMWLLFRGPRFNIAEAFAFALYAIGTFMFVHTLAVTPIVYFTHAWGFAQYAGFGLQLAVGLWLGLGLFGASAGNVLKLAIALAAGVVVWLVALVIGVGIYTVAAG